MPDSEPRFIILFAVLVFNIYARGHRPLNTPMNVGPLVAHSVDSGEIKRYLYTPLYMGASAQSPPYTPLYVWGGGNDDMELIAG